MRNLFTNHKYYIPHKSFTLWLFGDVHAGIKSFDKQAFIRFLKEAEKSDNPYFLGMGDYLDFASFSSNKKLNAGDLHETEEEWIDTRVRRDVEEFADLIKFMKGRLIGMVGGNHQFKLQSGQTSDEYLCELMKTKYLGWLSAINVLFETTGETVKKSVKIFACHGVWGGKLLGTSLNKLVDMQAIIPNCDIYAMGHDHQRMAVPKSTLMFRRAPNEVGFKLAKTRQFFVRTGSFQKSYVKDSSGFAQSKLMRPADIGAVRINVSIDRDCTNYKDERSLKLEAVI